MGTVSNRNSVSPSRHVSEPHLAAGLLVTSRDGGRCRYPSRLTNCRYLVVNYGWTLPCAFALLRALDFGATVQEARRAAEAVNPFSVALDRAGFGGRS